MSRRIWTATSVFTATLSCLVPSWVRSGAPPWKISTTYSLFRMWSICTRWWSWLVSNSRIRNAQKRVYPPSLPCAWRSRTKARKYSETTWLSRRISSWWGVIDIRGRESTSPLTFPRPLDLWTCSWSRSTSTISYFIRTRAISSVQLSCSNDRLISSAIRTNHLGCTSSQN